MRNRRLCLNLTGGASRLCRKESRTNVRETPVQQTLAWPYEARAGDGIDYLEASRPCVDIPSSHVLHPEFMPYGTLSVMAMTW